MKLAFIIYEGMTALDLIGIYDPLTRLGNGFIKGLEWDLCAFSNPVHDIQGMIFTANKIKPDLSQYDVVIIPGGLGSRERIKEPDFLQWISTASQVPLAASVCTGSLILGAAGILKGKRATTHPTAFDILEKMDVQTVHTRIVDEGNVVTAGGVTAAVDLGLYLCQKIAGTETAEKIRSQMDYPHPLLSQTETQSAQNKKSERIGNVIRNTRETQIEINLNIDGSGKSQIDSGLPFLDHMLTQVAVHGLFDLEIHAKGDIEIDPHHTMEDIALALGQAFREAAGDRTGIRRMASEFCPMDESLAQVTVDFSGRPYAVTQVEWHTPLIGMLPASLFQHFFESFATEARCNLHASIMYGRDDHHQAEALFKALGRALSTATRVDPRRSNQVPSSKGKLF